MKNMIKKRVAELEGAQLDWAVAKAEGHIPENPEWMFWEDEPQVNWYADSGERGGTLPLSSWGSPSTDWKMGGPIIERERITIDPIEDNQWSAHIFSRSVKGGWLQMTGASPLIAAMRAFVASKLGDEVEVPA